MREPVVVPVGREHAPAVRRVALHRVERRRRLLGREGVALAREKDDVVFLEVRGSTPERLGECEATATVRAAVGERSGELGRRIAAAPLALVEMNATRSARLREDAVVETDFVLSEQTLERVCTAGRERDERNVTLRRVLRQARLILVQQRSVSARGDLGDHDLPTPFSDLNDERHVVDDRHVFERKLAARIRQRGDQRIARESAACALVAGRSVRDREHGGVRNVDDDVVERVLPSGVVDDAADAGGLATRALTGTRDLLALEVHALMRVAPASVPLGQDDLVLVTNSPRRWNEARVSGVVAARLRSERDRAYRSDDQTKPGKTTHGILH